MSSNYSFRKVRDVLKELLEGDQLINGIIRTEDGKEFKVHLELLMSLSPYLKQRVNSLPNTPLKNLFVPSVAGDNMSTIINYAYTGKLAILPEKVENLMFAADILEISSVIGICVKFLESHLNEENCISVYTFAQQFEYSELYQKAKTFLLSNFEQIYPTSVEFLALSFRDMDMLARADELNVRSEEVTFWAIMRWVDHSPSDRRRLLPSLLGSIRFGLCAVEFYQNYVIPHPYICNNQDCQAVMYQASVMYVEMNHAPHESRPLDLHHPMIRPRVPHEIIFVIGGWSAGSATNVMETYDNRANRWFISMHMDTIPRAYHGLVSSQGLIYMIGGFDGNQCFNTVRCFDPATHSWKERACMHTSRCYISVASLDGHVYALGGYDGHVRVSTAERYNPKPNQWSFVRSMHMVRSDASATMLNGKIYIAGGFNGQQVLNSAEMYDPDTDEWTLIPDMSSPRSGVNLIAYNDAVYVIGGFNGNNRLATVEKFDRRLRQWTPVPPMLIPRSNFATATIEDRLFVIGGFNGLTTVPNVECYNSQTNLWLPVTDMNINRSALAACVLKGLPNAHQFSFLDNSSMPNNV